MGSRPASRTKSKSNSWHLLIAAELSALASGLAGVALVLLLIGHATLRDFDLTSVVLPFTLAAVGVVIVARAPRNPLGWLFVAAACIVGIEALGGAIAFRALALHQAPNEVGVWAEWIINWLGGLLFPAGLAAVMMLLIPNGRLPSRRWRLVLVAAPVIEAVLAFSQMFGPGPMQNAKGVPAVTNPLGVRALPILTNSTFEAIVWGVCLAYAIVATSAPLVRIRRASSEERQQLKWIAWPLVVTTVVYAAIAIGPTGLSSRGDGIVGWTVVIVGYGAALPVCIGVAILKCRLYSIDRAINRSVVYGILAAFITAVYLAVAVGIGSLIGSKSNLGLSLVATAIVAAGFQPVRVRAERLANRVVYGARATPYEALTQFSEQAAGILPVEEVLPKMARVIAEGTRALDACVWIRDGATLNPVAIWPASGIWPEPRSVHDVNQVKDGVHVILVRRDSELLGALSVRVRPTESLAPIEANLLNHLAGQVGLFLKNARLTAELEHSVTEVRASRQRIVRAEDEARRRIERDLHDGAQQHIVALTFLLGRAERDLAGKLNDTGSSIAELRAQAQAALDALRELAHGVYPQLLADRGLGAALQAHARRVDLEVSIEAMSISRYSAELEAAVYFCVLEALQNAQKHSHARRVRIALTNEDRMLAFSVSDDGNGFDVDRAQRGGMGLTSMSDRIAAEGGVLRIESKLGQGTIVSGRLPIGTATPTDAPPEAPLRSTSVDSNGRRGRQPSDPRGRAEPAVRR